MQNTIAVICDCDETLAPDTTVFLLGQNKIDLDAFWKKATVMVEDGWDPPLAYMTMILELMKACKIQQNTNLKLFELGKEVVPFAGVPEFVSELKALVKENKDFDEAGVNLEFYIISSGIEDLIKGSVLGKHFTDIYAGRFAEDPDTGIINAIKSSVTFTEKTKFLYAINKGIPSRDLRRVPYQVNDAIKAEDRRVPFDHMIYLGDGPSDIPCFSAVKEYGGNCISIVGNNTLHKGYELARGERTTVGPYSRNYKNGSDLRLMLETIIKQVGYRIVAKKKESRIP